MATNADPVGRLSEQSSAPLIGFRICILILFLDAIWFWPVGFQYVEVPPSFDCRKATLLTERTICADPILEKIDADFAVYYQDNLGATINFGATAAENQLAESERAFLSARNRCGREKWCIEREYLYQDLRIAAMVGEPHRVTAPINVYLNHYVGGYLKFWARTLAERLR